MTCKNWQGDENSTSLKTLVTSALVVGLAAAFAACRPPAEGPAETDAVDLVEIFALAETHAETRALDFGTARARAHLGAGWSWDETASDGTTFVWGVGPESWLELFLAEPRELRATVRCLPFTAPGSSRQSVTVGVNGRQVATLELRPEMAEYELALPASALRSGTNRLTFRYGYQQAPAAISRSSDRRRLAVAWDELRFGGAAEPGEPVARLDGEPAELYLPFGTEVAYYLDLPGPGRLTFDEIAVRGAGRLQVLWQVDGEEGRELILEPAAELPGDGRPARLALRAIGQAEDEGTWNGVRITRPAVRWPRRDDFSGHPTGVPTPVDGPRPNVLVYLVDTLRADRLGCYGQSEPLTPHVDRLAAEGVVFEKTLAQTSWTKPAVASILTGLGPLRHGVNQPSDALPEAARTLAEMLREAGYRTAAFVTNAHVTKGSGFAQGFDHFDFSEDLAGDLNARVLEWLDAGGERRRPFFVYVHTIDPHAPYEPLEPFRQRFASAVEDPEIGTTEHIRALGDKKAATTREVVAGLERLYNAEVAQNDAAFGALREGLERRALGHGTVIAFLSDHGEAFHEHGVFGHGWDLYQQVLEVPFVLRFPGAPRGARVGEVVQQVDLVPTLLDLVGLPAPDGLPGKSLVPLVGGAGVPASPRTVISYMSYEKREGLSVVWGEWKLIEPLGARFAARRELYRPWRDLLETRELAAEHPVLSGYLASVGRRELEKASQSLPAADAVLDEEARESLEALGYL